MLSVRLPYGSSSPQELRYDSQRSLSEASTWLPISCSVKGGSVGAEPGRSP